MSTPIVASDCGRQCLLVYTRELLSVLCSWFCLLGPLLASNIISHLRLAPCIYLHLLSMHAAPRFGLPVLAVFMASDASSLMQGFLMPGVLLPPCLRYVSRHCRFVYDRGRFWHEVAT